MDSYKIMSLEAKDIFGSMNCVSSGDRGYSIRSTNGDLNLGKFTAAFDWSLDAIKLAEVFGEKASLGLTRENKFSFRMGKHTYTKNVICVTFKYAYKEFNRCGKNTFVKHGYLYRDCDFDDGVYVKDGELIGIQTNVEIRSPVPQEILGKYFVFTDGFYQQAKKIPTVMDKAALRNYLYKNGFKCDGVEYVRYKRSSGSSRVGKCLFVNKVLAADMEEWDKCGLEIKDGQEIDLAAFESYRSLPMSSIIDTIDVPLDSILVINDYDSVFNDDVVAVEIEDNHLVSSQKETKVRNCIWDGQSLMDVSLFGKYADKGMLLLRNRFFKSCCFNTNVQQWFADNNITSVDQLNGFTLAEDISQVKFITTPSSLKYVKFGPMEKWFDVVSSTFGVVKFEKQPHPFSGRLVQSHYQLFNTLQLSYEEMESILAPSLDYISAIRNDPAVLRYKIQFPEEIQDDVWSSMRSKNEIVFRMLGINDRFADTKLYRDFRDDLVKGEIRELKRGRVLINGNYSTLMGNGIEMLQESIGQFNGKSVIGKGNIHCKRFEYGKTVLCSRSPHVTMGNVLLTTNSASELYDTYFNLTPEIVCVNSIEENILQRLNGADFDSDTMLITDNQLLIEAAQRNYHLFKVPTNLTESTKTKRYYTCDDQADLDVKTSVNKIGEIINLSQHLNSIMWDRINRGQKAESCMDLYNDICKLAVLSNIEIDRAKREFVIVSATELGVLKRKYRITDDDRSVKPMFFKMITLENGFDLPENIRYKYFNTAMDYLQKIISRFNFRKGRAKKTDVIPFMDIVRRPEGNIDRAAYFKTRDRIIQIIRDAREEKHRLMVDYATMSPDERKRVWSIIGDIKSECIEEVEALSKSQAVMYHVLKALDNKEYSDVSRFIFEVVFGKPDENFYDLIVGSREDIYTLVEDGNGDITIHGFCFSKKKIAV